MADFIDVNAAGGGLTAGEAQTACEQALEDKKTSLATEVVALLNTGTAVVSRVKASAAEAVAEATTAIASAVATALDTGSAVLSRIVASVSSSIAAKVADDTIPSDADVAAVPANTATAFNTGTSVLSRVRASVTAALNDAATVPLSSTTTAGVATMQVLNGAGDTVLGNIRESCEAAITAAGLVTSQDFAGTLESTFDTNKPVYAAETKALAVGTRQRTIQTFSGAGTTGTLIAAPGPGLKIEVIGFIASCSVATSTFQMTSSGGETGASHTLAVGQTVPFALPFAPYLIGGTNAAVTVNKTSGATITIEAIYRALSQ